MECTNWRKKERVNYNNEAKYQYSMSKTNKKTNEKKLSLEVWGGEDGVRHGLMTTFDLGVTYYLWGVHYEALVCNRMFLGGLDVSLAHAPAPIVYQDGPVALLNSVLGGRRCVGAKRRVRQQIQSVHRPQLTNLMCINPLVVTSTTLWIYTTGNLSSD